MFSSRKRGLHGLGPTPLSEAKAVPYGFDRCLAAGSFFPGDAEMAYTLQFACGLIHTSKAFHAMVWAPGLRSFAMKTSTRKPRRTSSRLWRTALAQSGSDTPRGPDNPLMIA